MKKLFLLLVLPILLVSCQITEEVNFEKDGSGVYNMSVDMSSMMDMVKGVKQENDSIKTNKKPEKFDSIMLFSDILKEHKDSLKRLTKEEKELLNALKDAKIRLKVDENNGEMLMAYIIPFKDVSDLNNINQKLQKLNELNKKNKQQGTEALEDILPKNEVIYTLNNRKFTRRVKKLKNNAKKPENKNENSQKMAQMMNMLRYKIIYRFPYEVKSVSYKNALIGADGKSVHIEVPVDSLIKHPEMLDFEVKFR